MTISDTPGEGLADLFDKLPDGYPMTPGSPFTAEQITIGDFRCAATALASVKRFKTGE